MTIPSVRRLTSLDQVTSGNQTSVAGTDHDGLPNVTIIGVSDPAFGLDDTISMETTNQAVLLGVDVAVVGTFGVVAGHGDCYGRVRWGIGIEKATTDRTWSTLASSFGMKTRL